jgi:hypothetical protein
MAMTKSPLPFVRLNYTPNRTPTGKRTATPARRAARYFAFGNDLEARHGAEQRGRWVGPNGKTHDHEAVLAWIAAQAREHAYTFQALLSVPEGRLRAEDFSRAMQEGKTIDDWRLLSHDDTAYSHAHVLFFRNSRLDKESFADWRERVRRELAALEAANLQAGERSVVAQLSAEERQGASAQQPESPDAARQVEELDRAGGLELR